MSVLIDSYETLDETKRDELHDVLSEYFGYETFHPFQEQVVGAITSDRDSLTVISTGGGKSLCYQLPSLVAEGTAVVISPLISLMQDQVANLEEMGISSAYVNSTLTPDERRTVRDELLAGELDLLYMAPERLKFESTRTLLDRTDVPYFVIDEAHCISQWGHDFREAYRNLHEIKEWFPGMKVHAFTATATPEVQEDIVDQLNLEDPVTTVGPVDRPNLTYRVRPRTDEFEQVRDVLERHEDEAGIVYCLRRKDVDRLSRKLNDAGFDTYPYHAGLSDEVRREHQQKFQEEKIDVIVSTVAFGMGIDRANIRFVVHAAMPKTVEHYQQETGRAGRDGEPAECVLLFGGDDYVTWKRIFSDSSNRERMVDKLNDISSFCYQPVCRHRYISNYFGQDSPEEDCGACDYCLGELDPVDDPRTLGQKIVSCVARVDEQFGAVHVTDVLKGSTKDKVKKWDHDEVSTHGLLEERSRSFIRHMIDQLIGQRFLARDPEHRSLKITRQGWDLLRDDEKPNLVKPVETGSGQTTTTGTQKESKQSLTDVEEDLFEALKGIRSDLAEENEVPAYVILHDRSLREMARAKPESERELEGIHGIGTVKAEKYGEPFLSAIAEFEPTEEKTPTP